MIEIKNLVKSYSKESDILRVPYFCFPDKGFVAIVGASGSGKTTLLNILAGLDNEYRGQVIIDGRVTSKCNLENCVALRLFTVGYLKQSDSLIESLTVKDNITLPLRYGYQVSKEMVEARISTLLSFVGLNDQIMMKKVGKLSGGERQRVALVRALINNPSIILCDEPTGALSGCEKEAIYELLTRLSVNRLVIMVTHDEKGAQIWCQEVITIVNHNLQIKIKSPQKSIEAAFSLLNIKARVQPKLDNTTINHYNRAFDKHRPFRVMIVRFILSFALLSFGLSFSLSDILYSKIKESLTNYLGENQIVVKSRQPIELDDHGYRLEEVNNLCINLDKEMKSGYAYYANWDVFFKTVNQVSVGTDGLIYYLPSFSFINFIEPLLYFEMEDATIYPLSVELNEPEDIILGLPFVDYETVKQALKLPFLSDYSYLGNYLVANPLSIILHLANSNWGYEDEHIFAVRGVFPSDVPRIVVNEVQWTQHFVEEKMGFPTYEHQAKSSINPWEIACQSFVYSQQAEKFIAQAQKDSNLAFTIFDNSATNTFFSTLPDNVRKHRIILYRLRNKAFHRSDLDKMEKILSARGVLTNTGSYFADSGTPVFGFIDTFLVSRNENSLRTIIDELSYLPAQNDPTDYHFPQEIVGGSFINTSTTNLTFSSASGPPLSGEWPQGLKEIALSRSLAVNFFMAESKAPGQTIYLSYPRTLTKLENGYTLRNYEVVAVRVSGVFDLSGNKIIHDSDWSSRFFSEQIGMSPLSLISDGAIISLPINKKIDTVINQLKRAFPDLIVSSPSKEFFMTLNSTLDAVSFVLLIFASLSAIITVMLLFIISGISRLEEQKERMILVHIGIKKTERLKIYQQRNFLLIIKSLFLSWGQFILLSNGMTYFLAQYFHNQFYFAFNLKGFMAMALIAFLLSILSNALLTNKKSHQKA
ncbi:MAG TPA: ABC transporter ATP-binding protein [Bacilli bacterium]|nr:ABC transporter ATP-binding protein [Bacilli bacterium]